MRLQWCLLAAMLAAAACRERPQEARPMGGPAQAMTEKRKEADFPAEKVEKPKDLEAGEGLPQSYKDAIQKRLGKARKPKKSG